VISAWAGEASSYDLRANTCSGMCGHSTQIVWRTTRRVGGAVAGGGRPEVWACNYDLLRNGIGYRPD
jgi:pathogenesis-related protein 1